MTAKVQKLLNDSGVARWSALVLIALMMFFAYMFVDLLSPLSTLLETSKGWSAETYGTFCSSEYFLNVFERKAFNRLKGLYIPADPTEK